uniref:Uncharacterized protein n=1 Tax=Kwoniella dejecticola CBS 10117 TaxID=1296121 RepID=A0A1A6A7N5_9TREE|nr:uncharacterized protein I303_03788 [Kwoniella dejecticola CBS 10117]OBR86070.1 hypothetical protein I303_03788 [Kwoniella dejecticola CBS 10117]
MPRRRNTSRIPPKSTAPLSHFRTRLDLLTYAFSRLPPRQLPFLATYAYVIIYATDKGWIDKAVLGKGGASVVGVLSMVTGLLVSYRFSSAITKWDEGRQVWAAVRITIRDGMRMLSIAASPTASSEGSAHSCPVDLGEATESTEGDSPSTVQSSLQKDKGKEKDVQKKDLVAQRVDELAGLLVGFAFALQHHLHGTRPLPQAPLCDLLPSAYLSSLKRTEARVRFAESHAGPSGSSPPTIPSTPIANTDPSGLDQNGILRPGLRRRGTAEEAVNKLTEAIALSGLSDEGLDLELKQQLNQLNTHGQGDNTASIVEGQTNKPKVKSNLHSPNPSNLPLAILKLIESYIVGLAGIEEKDGGWNDSKRERGLGLVKALSENLGEAERLSSNPPPLPLTLHLSHLLIIYLAALPCSLLCVVNGWALIVITLIAGWCFLGLEALIGEVGGVFGSSENHLPLPLFSQQILNESLDISSNFLDYYRNRLIVRLGNNRNNEDQAEIDNIDRKKRRTEGEWYPSFS